MNSVMIDYTLEGAALATTFCIFIFLFSLLLKIKLSYGLYYFLFSLFVFIYITHFPVPDPDEMTCPIASASPQVRLFNFFEIISRNFASSGSIMAVVESRIFVATGLNFLSCFVIGSAFLLSNIRFKFLIPFAVLFPVFIETSQITGVFFIFPCAYRQFNVDDLTMNFSGIFFGYFFTYKFQKYIADLRR